MPHSRLSQVLYLFAALAWLPLLWPYPNTMFLGACFACLTLPIYRRLKVKSAYWRRKLRKKNASGIFSRLIYSSTFHFPIFSYLIIIMSAFIVPIAVLVMLVSPQAVAGIAKLRELRDSNFQMPPSIMEYFHHFRAILSEYPKAEKIYTDFVANIDNFISDTASILVSRSFGFVGSTMSVFWLIFLFFTVSTLLVVYSELIRKVFCRILNVPPVLIRRFTVSIYRALKAVLLGIVLVALIQGFMCGIAFAVAGVTSPAFWGLLATIVAPIPMVGTALVWVPLCLSLWFTGNVISAVGLAIWGTVFVAGADNILRPFFLRQGIHASFFVLILAMLCGLSVFGAVGLILGPVLLAVAMQALEEANHYYGYAGKLH